MTSFQLKSKVKSDQYQFAHYLIIKVIWGNYGTGANRNILII